MAFERSPSRLRLMLLLAGCVSAACGVSDRHVSLASGGGAGSAGTLTRAGAGGSEPTAGASGNGGSPESAGAAGDIGAGAAGEAGESGEAGASGAGPVEPGCTVGAAPYCFDSFTPALCVSGVWVKQTACGGNKPVCSNGVCANATLFGGIVTVVSPPATAGIHIVDQGFEFAQPAAPATTSCGQVHQGLTVCVTGGLTAHAVAPALASGGSGS